MGIQDFSLDLTEHLDRALVVSVNEQSRSRMTKALELRSIRCDVTDDLVQASTRAAKELFDVVVIDASSLAIGPADAVQTARSHVSLRRIPLVVVDSKALPGGVSDISATDELRIITGPWDPSDFLVKTTTLLRLRKQKRDQAGLESKVSAQNARLRDLTMRFQRELTEAREIQRATLPKKLPSGPGFRVSASYVPLEALGGDLYDAWMINDDCLGLVIADVTGHGLSAAFLGAMTKMALSYSTKNSPDLMLQEMNEGLVEHMPEGKFVTVAAAFYEPLTGKIQIARGGHPEPYIWRAASGEVTTATPRGLPLGFAGGIRFELFSASLEPGDKLLFVTDGLTEAANMDGIMLGTEGLGKIFAAAAKGSTVDDCIKQVLDELQRFCDGRTLKDDLTLVGLERLKEDR